MVKMNDEYPPYPLINDYFDQQNNICEQINEDLWAMQLIRDRKVGGVGSCYFKGDFIGFSCGIGPIRDDPSQAVIAAFNGENDGLDERLEELGYFTKVEKE